MARPEADKSQVTRSANQARQGVTRHNVRYVLAVSLLGAVAAFVLVAWLMA